MKQDQIGYGRTLSELEYQQLTIDTNARYINDPSAVELLANAELNLMIDYRLGINYPETKRRRLEKIQHGVRNNVIIQYLLLIPGASLITGSIISKIIKHGYSKVFSSAEMKRYFNE